ncbi:MAG: mechanosensitive ion channel [Proteiniphilum sp.]|nr:mechanosensitive ion channel [Proteiniphilum sp.]MDD3333002.1 mechanosensitive ion channel [Proteiniphilum sp.]MDD3979897.1 mechanosensitive ion channel [Proteiniphilum sp.]
MDKLRDFIEYEIFRIGEYSFTNSKIITVALVVLSTMGILSVIKKLLFRKKIENRYDRGNLYSLFQIIKYFVWIIAILIMLEELGLKLNALLAGSAALLVGIGLGLQNTFNNFVSGIILLFEGSIHVGDVLEIDDDVVQIEKIGLRTSKAIDRDYISVIIPNSLITSNKVVNWSHQDRKTRFRIKVGVAYGSDVDLVIKVLRESALDHKDISDKSSVIARFVDFGSSSLDFELLFFSDNVFRIENVKSDIRKIINEKFIEHKISIPFPQVDLHFVSDKTGFFDRKRGIIGYEENNG